MSNLPPRGFVGDVTHDTYNTVQCPAKLSLLWISELLCLKGTMPMKKIATRDVFAPTPEGYETLGTHSFGHLLCHS